MVEQFVKLAAVRRVLVREPTCRVDTWGRQGQVLYRLESAVSATPCQAQYASLYSTCNWREAVRIHPVRNGIR